jgi:cell division septum initiation protein DivIVA
MTELPNEIDELKALIRQLLEENARLKAENAELRRRLGLDSGNSDKPPNRDGYQKKTVKPGLPKEKKRAKGGQEGHEGNTLKRLSMCKSMCRDNVKVAGVHSARMKRKLSTADKSLTCRNRDWK